MSADSTAPKQRGRPFPKGQSGNPSGRLIGARKAATVIAEQLFDVGIEKIIRKVIDWLQDSPILSYWPKHRYCGGRKWLLSPAD